MTSAPTTTDKLLDECRQLREDNARLAQRNNDLLLDIERLTRERDGLLKRIETRDKGEE
jgi:hypothetical protein